MDLTKSINVIFIELFNVVLYSLIHWNIFWLERVYSAEMRTVLTFDWIRTDTRTHTYTHHNEIGQTFNWMRWIWSIQLLLRLRKSTRKIICIVELIQYGCYYDTIEFNLFFHGCPKHKAQRIIPSFSGIFLFDWFSPSYIAHFRWYAVWTTHI